MTQWNNVQLAVFFYSLSSLGIGTIADRKGGRSRLEGGWVTGPKMQSDRNNIFQVLLLVGQQTSEERSWWASTMKSRQVNGMLN